MAQAFTTNECGEDIGSHDDQKTCAEAKEKGRPCEWCPSFKRKGRVREGADALPPSETYSNTSSAQMAGRSVKAQAVHL